MSHLRLLAVSSVFFLLSGCAVVASLYDSYFLARYDSVEYYYFSKIRTQSEQDIKDCTNAAKSKENFIKLDNTAGELKNFSQYIPNNKDAYKLAGNVSDLTKQGRDMYDKDTPPSEAFCKLKLQQINRAAETAQKAIGSKPR